MKTKSLLDMDYEEISMAVGNIQQNVELQDGTTVSLKSNTCFGTVFGIIRKKLDNLIY